MELDTQYDAPFQNASDIWRRKKNNNHLNSRKQNQSLFIYQNMKMYKQITLNAFIETNQKNKSNK